MTSVLCRRCCISNPLEIMRRFETTVLYCIAFLKRNTIITVNAPDLMGTGAKENAGGVQGHDACASDRHDRLIASNLACHVDI